VETSSQVPVIDFNWLSPSDKMTTSQRIEKN